jgi:hypothetical protein
MKWITLVHRSIPKGASAAGLRAPTADGRVDSGRDLQKFKSLVWSKARLEEHKK